MSMPSIKEIREKKGRTRRLIHLLALLYIRSVRKAILLIAISSKPVRHSAARRTAELHGGGMLARIVTIIEEASAVISYQKRM